MTLMANVQPLSEVLLLWDRLFAIGVHNIVLVFCAHLINLRIPILQQSSGYKISTLIEHASLEADVLMRITLSILPRITSELAEELLQHTTVTSSPIPMNSSVVSSV
jgi:cell cycle arrest protein BUB2